MSNQAIKIQENTQQDVSAHLVGVANIFERELPDERGVVTKQVSASLYISPSGAKDSRKQIVIVGSDVALGADRYCVVRIDEGKETPGSVELKRVLP